MRGPGATNRLLPSRQRPLCILIEFWMGRSYGQVLDENQFHIDISFKSYACFWFGQFSKLFKEPPFPLSISVEGKNGSKKNERNGS